MTKVRKHTSRGKRYRQERALARRRQELERFESGDFLDRWGLTLIRKDLPSDKRRKRKDRKIEQAKQEIQVLKERVQWKESVPSTSPDETSESFVGLELK